MKDGFEFLKNPVSGKWVIIAPKRAGRPTVAKGTEPACPFCPGHENQTPPEVYRSGRGKKDKPGWQIRIVPNKYPFAPVHEVIIDAPQHDSSFFDHDPIYIARLFKIYKERFHHWKKEGQVFIFYNYGVEAAASLSHPHAQFVVIPKKVRVDVTRAVVPENIIHETKYFTVFIPHASDWPYEVWFLPKKRGRLFDDASIEEIDNLSSLLSTILHKLEAILGERFPFNFHIYHGGDWYLRLIPRLRIVGGFEIATGVYVHSTSPKEAAKKLAW